MINLPAARLVAAREIREQMRGRPLWISTAVTVIAIVLLVVLPKVLASGPPTYQVGVSGSASPAVKAAIVAAGRNVGAKITLRPIANRDEATTLLRGQGKGKPHLDIAVLGPTTGAPDTVLVDRAFPASSTDRKALAAESIARAVSVAEAIEKNDVPPAAAKAITQPTPLPIDHLRPAPASAATTGVAFVGAVIFFFLALRYGVGLMMGVVQEKSTRVIEVIVSAVRPIDLLAGKVAGYAVIALSQAALLVVTALVSAAAVGSDIIKGGSAGTIVLAFVWVVIGFFLYSTLFTAVGSLASKAEDAQSVGFPVQIPLFVGYIASTTAVGGGTPSAFVKVLAYIPFTAPMNMPMLAATGGANGWQIGLSMAITVAAVLAAIRVSALLFSRSILRTGGRLRAREVLREPRHSPAGAR